MRRPYPLRQQKSLSPRHLLPLPAGWCLSVCGGSSGNLIPLKEITATAPSVELERLLLLILKDDSSLNPTAQTWPSKSDGQPPKMATAQGTMFCPLTG